MIMAVRIMIMILDASDLLLLPSGDKEDDDNYDDKDVTSFITNSY